MPILDYKGKANLAEQRVLTDSNISEQNRRILRRFLTAYDVSDARRLLFINHIKKLLEHFPELEPTLTDRDAINEFFAKLRLQYSPATYATYLNITRRFLTWLNDGEQPLSMRDLKTKSKEQLKRSLRPEDMVTWKDGELISDTSCSIQIAAMTQTQLDCGFRPSEFVDLNYGDVLRSTGLAVFSVRDGKTGGRDVVAHRCIPALFKWLDAHPTKRAEDPLWISEKSTTTLLNGDVQVKRYEYRAMCKRIHTLARRIGINKPIDFYNLRHSSCVLDKKDNLPTDLAAERHGHSVKHFVKTYGRLSVDDVIQRFESHYGMRSQQASPTVTHQTCTVCKAVNEQGRDFCSSCGTPTNTQGAYNVLNQSKEETAQMQSEFKQMKEELEKSHQREALFREQQLEMLRQMQDIKVSVLQQRGHANVLVRD